METPSVEIMKRWLQHSQNQF